MGADLYFMLADKTQADKFNNFIEESEQGKRLNLAERNIWVVDNSDIDWTKSDNCNSKAYFQNYYKENFGRGVWKASGCSFEELEKMGFKTFKEYFACVAELFAEAQKHFEIYFYAGSCAFTLSETYFSIEDMQKMTLYGKYLKFARHNPEKSEQLLNLLMKGK